MELIDNQPAHAEMGPIYSMIQRIEQRRFELIARGEDPRRDEQIAALIKEIVASDAQTMGDVMALMALCHGLCRMTCQMMGDGPARQQMEAAKWLAELAMLALERLTGISGRDFRPPVN